MVPHCQPVTLLAPFPSGLVLLLTMTTWSPASAQTVQSGLLYWASLVEGGSNFAYLGVAPGLPRTAWAIYDTNQSSLVPAAHLAALKTNNQAYNFSNGEPLGRHCCNFSLTTVTAVCPAAAAHPP